MLVTKSEMKRWMTGVPSETDCATSDEWRGRHNLDDDTRQKSEGQTVRYADYWWSSHVTEWRLWERNRPLGRRMYIADAAGKQLEAGIIGQTERAPNLRP